MNVALHEAGTVQERIDKLVHKQNSLEVHKGPLERELDALKEEFSKIATQLQVFERRASKEREVNVGKFNTEVENLRDEQTVLHTMRAALLSVAHHD